MDEYDKNCPNVTSSVNHYDGIYSFNSSSLHPLPRRGCSMGVAVATKRCKKIAYD